MNANKKLEIREGRQDQWKTTYTVYHTQTPGIFLRVEAGLDGGIMSLIVCCVMMIDEIMNRR